MGGAEGATAGGGGCPVFRGSRSAGLVVRPRSVEGAEVGAEAAGADGAALDVGPVELAPDADEVLEGCARCC